MLLHLDLKKIYLEDQQHKYEDKANLDHHDYKLSHYMGQHDLQTGDPSNPGSVQQALFSLNDETDASQTHCHEVGDR